MAIWRQSTIMASLMIATAGKLFVIATSLPPSGIRVSLHHNKEIDPWVKQKHGPATVTPEQQKLSGSQMTS
jgi:hypothetical protein